MSNQNAYKSARREGITSYVIDDKPPMSNGDELAFFGYK